MWRASNTRQYRQHGTVDDALWPCWSFKIFYHEWSRSFRCFKYEKLLYYIKSEDNDLEKWKFMWFNNCVLEWFSLPRTRDIKLPFNSRKISIMLKCNIKECDNYSYSISKNVFFLYKIILIVHLKSFSFFRFFTELCRYLVQTVICYMMAYTMHCASIMDRVSANY